MKQVVPKEVCKDKPDARESESVEKRVREMKKRMNAFLREGEKSLEITEKDLQTLVD